MGNFQRGDTAGLALFFAAGLSPALAGASNDALSALFLSRLAACDRLRVFFRALVFGIGEVPSSSGF
jgi:hypothetical protein